MNKHLAVFGIGLLSCANDPRTDNPGPVDASAPGVSTSAIPAGAMMAFAGPRAPAGWLPCDGRVVNSSDYPELFSAIGNSWGDGGDGPGPLFNIPDMRGLFPRGVDSGAMRDPEAKQRAAIAQGGNVGDQVGSSQDYSTSAPRKPMSAVITATLSLLYAVAGTTYQLVEAPMQQNVQWTGGDAETRPRNVAVNWIVKY